MKQWFYAVRKVDADGLSIHQLLDMLRYDAAVPVLRENVYAINDYGKWPDVQAEMATRYVFSTDNGPALGRWASFGVRDRGAILNVAAQPLPKPARGMKPIYFLIKREAFEQFGDSLITGREQKDREVLINLMARDRASVMSNPPYPERGEWYLFRSERLSFAAWREAGLEVHAATYEYSDMRGLADRPPLGRDVVLRG